MPHPGQSWPRSRPATGSVPSAGSTAAFQQQHCLSNLVSARYHFAIETTLHDLREMSGYAWEYGLLFCLFKGTTETQNSVALSFCLPQPKKCCSFTPNTTCGSSSSCHLSQRQVTGWLYPFCRLWSWGKALPDARQQTHGWHQRQPGSAYSHHPCFAPLCATAKLLPLGLKQHTSCFSAVPQSPVLNQFML